MRVRAIFSCVALTLAVTLLTSLASLSRAQAPAAGKPSEGEAVEEEKSEDKAAVVELAKKQSDIADKFKRLQGLMIRMAEFEKGTNPRRAALLKEAYAEADRNHINLQMETLIKLLGRDELQRAVG